MKQTFGSGSQSRVSNREYFLIASLLILVLGYLLIFQLVLPKWEAYQGILQQNEIREGTVNRLKVDFDKKAEYEKEIADFKTKMDGKKKELPPYLSQGEILLLMDRVSQENALVLNTMSFNLIELLQENAYLAKDSNAKDGTEGQAAAPEASPAASPATTGTQTTPVGNATADQNAYIVAEQQVILSFAGPYESIHAFLKAMETNIRKVYTRNLVLSSDGAGNLTGTVQLAFLSFIDAGNMEKYLLDLKLEPGRMDPFTPYEGYDNGLDDTGAVVLVDIPDFSVKVNNYLDNAPKIQLQPYPEALSEMSAEQNVAHIAKLTLKGDDKAFTFVMMLDGKAITGKSAVEIRNGAIQIHVFSQSRRDATDLVSLTLDLDNQTLVPVYVIVVKDDAQNQRFRMGKISGDVKVK